MQFRSDPLEEALAHHFARLGPCGAEVENQTEVENENETEVVERVQGRAHLYPLSQRPFDRRCCPAPFRPLQ